MMRSKFDEQLDRLNKEMMKMGGLENRLSSRAHGFESHPLRLSRSLNMNGFLFARGACEHIAQKDDASSAG